MKPPQRSVAPAVPFQAQKAVADGSPRTDLTLRLTLRDAALLKRDRTLAVSDISFGQGVMYFLGVPGGEGRIDRERRGAECSFSARTATIAAGAPTLTVSRQAPRSGKPVSDG